jgi:hypothetical protein
MLCNSTDCILLGALALHPQGKRGWQLDGFRQRRTSGRYSGPGSRWPVASDQIRPERDQENFESF